jgi:hypothetical protein
MTPIGNPGNAARKHGVFRARLAPRQWLDQRLAVLSVLSAPLASDVQQLDDLLFCSFTLGIHRHLSPFQT